MISFAVRNRHKYDRSLFDSAVNSIDLELEGIQKEKEFIMSEERLREAIREKIQERYGNVNNKEEMVGTAYKLTGTEQDAKLDREIKS